MDKAGQVNLEKEKTGQEGPAIDLSALDQMPGAAIVCPDGIAGRLDMLGVRPRSDEITHLIVRRGFLFPRDVLVAVEWIEAISPEENRIHLKARASQVAAMPEYRPAPDLVGLAWSLATLPLRLPLQLLLRRWQDGRPSDAQERLDQLARRQQAMQAMEEQRAREVDPKAFDKAARAGAHLINLNTASQEELEEINGIGPALAQAIIERRPINNLDELINSLQELSPQTAERLRKVTCL